MQSIKELIKDATAFLKAKGILHPHREAWDLLAICLNRRDLDVFWDLDTFVEEKEVKRYREWVRRRGNKEPFGYIVGEVLFLDLKLGVNRSTLIPRQESEIFADRIIQRLPKTRLEVWDVCCGTGCLGLAIKKKRPTCTVILSDLSKDALQLAELNAQKNSLEVTFLCGDLLQPFIGKRADMVVCNPPYVTLEEYEELEEEVRCFEPKTALVGGLDFYQRLAEELPPFLKPSAKVCLEIGSKQGNEVREIFSKRCWIEKKCEKDWAGQDRFFFLEYRERFSLK